VNANCTLFLLVVERCCIYSTLVCLIMNMNNLTHSL
jgi:hypothetical protein